MKYIIIPCLLLSTVSFSQDCKLKKETDPFTHIIRLTTGFVPFVSKTGVHFSLSVDATSSDIDFFFLSFSIFGSSARSFDGPTVWSNVGENACTKALRSTFPIVVQPTNGQFSASLVGAPDVHAVAVSF